MKRKHMRGAFATLVVGTLGFALVQLRTDRGGDVTQGARSTHAAAHGDVAHVPESGRKAEALEVTTHLDSSALIRGDASRSAARADDARPLLRLDVRDERGHALPTLEIERRALGATSWTPLPGELFDVSDAGTAVEIDAARVAGERLRIGAPWHVWEELDPALAPTSVTTVTLQLAGVITAHVRGRQPGEQVTFELTGPDGGTQRIESPANTPPFASSAPASEPTGKSVSTQPAASAGTSAPVLLERLRPGTYHVSVARAEHAPDGNADAAEPPSNALDVDVFAGRNVRACFELQSPAGAASGGLDVSLTGAELGTCALDLRLVVSLRGETAPSLDEDTERRVEPPVASGWTTSYRGLPPGGYVVLVEPLGIRRRVVIEPSGTAKLALEIGSLARTAVTFHDAVSGATVEPRAVVASLRTQDGVELVRPTRARDGSRAYVFCTSPGELAVDCDDPLWAGAEPGFDVRTGWNAAVVELRRSARLRLRAEPGRIELPEDFWSQVCAHRTNGERVDLGRSMQYVGSGAARSLVLELVVPCGEELEVATPAALEYPAQTFRVTLAAGEKVERTVARLR